MGASELLPPGRKDHRLRAPGGAAQEARSELPKPRLIAGSCPRLLWSNVVECCDKPTVREEDFDRRRHDTLRYSGSLGRAHATKPAIAESLERRLPG